MPLLGKKNLDGWLDRHERLSVLRWDGVVLVIIAALSVGLLVLLPEALIELNRNLTILAVVLSISLAYGYYFSPLSRGTRFVSDARFVWIPMITLPTIIVLFMFGLPSVWYLYLFLMFLVIKLEVMSENGSIALSIGVLTTLTLVMLAVGIGLSELGVVAGSLAGLVAAVGLILFRYQYVLFNHEKSRLARQLEQAHKRANRFQMRDLRGQAILDLIDNGVVVVDHKNQIQVFNREAQKLLGWNLDQVQGRSVESVLGFTPDFLVNEATMKGFFGKFLVGPIQQSGMRLKKKQSGRKVSNNPNSADQFVFADITLYPLQVSESGNPPQRYFMLVLKDVTRDVAYQRAKLDFVAMAAHELRAPVTSIIGYLSVIIEELTGQNEITEEQKEFLERAFKSGQTLSGVIENILSITKIERGERPIHQIEINWPAMLSEKVIEYQSRALEKGLQIKWIPPVEDVRIGPYPPVWADPLLISEVLNNLIGNAIKYTDQGLVRVWCEYKPAKSVIVTHIKDTGSGIPQDRLQHLFERFYRVTGTLGETTKGTGLGLYISKVVIQQHGGEVWVESREAEGSTFSFSLPTHKHRQKN